MTYKTKFYVKKLDNTNIRIIFFDDEGYNFWYDMPNPFPFEIDFFWNDNSEGYARLYFINEAPLYGPNAPKWIKEDCGWIL